MLEQLKNELITAAKNGDFTNEEYLIKTIRALESKYPGYSFKINLPYIWIQEPAEIRNIQIDARISE